MADSPNQRGWQAAITASFESPPRTWGFQRDLRPTLNVPAIGLAHFGLDGDFLLVSDQFCSILGYSRTDLLARSFQDVTFPGDGPTYVTLTAELAAGMIPSYRVEKHLVRPDGSALWLRVTVSVVRQENGSVGFFLGIAEDISDQKTNEFARREAEDRLHAALEASQTGTFRWDIRSNRLDWDDSLDRLVGWEPGETTRSLEQFVSVVHAEDRARVVEAYWLCAGDGVDFNQEFRVVRPDDSVRWLRARGRTFCAADGSALYMTGACTDVTEHRRMEDELRVQEAQFRTLANAIPQLAWMTDPSGWIYWYNQRWYEYTGTTPEEMQGWGWQKVHHPEHVRRVVENISRSFETGEPWEDTFPLRGKDGQYRWFLSRALPMHDVQGRRIGWFGTNTDITERLEAERAVRESEAHLRRITDSGIIGVLYWTLAGEITDANDEFCRMFGWSRQDVKAGLSWRTLTPPEFQEIDRIKAAEVAERGAVTQWEKELYAKDGRRVPVLIAAALLDGFTDRGVAVCLDITDRKTMEVERDRLLALEHEARTAAERASRLRDEVLAIVAHDLRSPVQAIVMSASAMSRLLLRDQRESRHLGIIQRSAWHMERLIQDLMSVSRLEAGNFPIDPGIVELNALVEETLEVLQDQARASKITLRCEFAGDLPAVRCDRDRIIQVLTNLVENALKFTHEGGTITVRVRPNGNLVETSVIDNGAGIPAENLPHVFDRFWQANPRSRKGAGLGLVIAKGIVEAHGGYMTVESTLGVGTSFHFSLPAAPALQSVV